MAPHRTKKAFCSRSLSETRGNGNTALAYGSLIIITRERWSECSLLSWMEKKIERSNKWATGILSAIHWLWKLTKNVKQEWWWAIKTLRKEENRREDAKANVGTLIFLVAFWASISCDYAFPDWKKRVSWNRGGEKNPHRSLSCVNDGI